MSTVALVDYGMGNRRSVEKALEHVGATVARTADPEEIRAADAVVVPGVGAFPEAMRRLQASGLDEVIKERADGGTPVPRPTCSPPRNRSCRSPVLQSGHPRRS